MALGQRAQTLKRVPAPGGQPGEECWEIVTDKERHYTRTAVLTAGIGAFQPIKVKNESVDRFEGRGVGYIARDFQEYAGKRVLIVGGGDSAVDWALALEPIARHVTLIHRREGFRAHDASVHALNASNVEVLLYFELRALEGEEHVRRAVIFDNRSQEEKSLEVDEVILALGFKADLGPVREWGLETIGRRFVKVNARMETNLPGVYAAGDVALQEDVDPLNLIVIGYGQVTVATNYAYTFVRPGAKVFPGHSSEKMAGVPGR
jgi:thioredoxin reductase (NADPH)